MSFNSEISFDGHRIDDTGATRPIRLTALVGLGYFCVWALIGLAVFLIGVALATLARQVPSLARVVPLVASSVVLMAGLLQFTAWKANRLDCCRTTLRCHVSATSRTTWSAAWLDGLHLGFQCSCCCAGLTVILLVIGVMNLLAMAVVAAVITVERLAPSVKVARMIGVVIVAAGVFMIIRLNCRSM